MALDDVLRSDQLTIPLRQRAKFEGWLKIELAHNIESRGMKTTLEHEFRSETAVCRADIVVQYRENLAALMLKTANTNFRFDGVLNKSRPITKNVFGVMEDVNKLKYSATADGPHFVCFVFFPVSAMEAERDRQLGEYLVRILECGCRIGGRAFVERGRGWGIEWFVAECDRA